MLEIGTSIALGMLAIAAVLCILRMLRAESLSDRIVALDALLVIVVLGLAVLAARTGEETFLDAMVVAALLGFTSTSFVAMYIEKRGP